MCSLLLIGCSTPGTDDPQDPEGSLGPLISDEMVHAKDPTQVSVESDDLGSRDALVLTDVVALEDVLAAAAAGPTPEHAEDFALKAMIYLGDDQNGRVGPEEIATL
jgi:hypothetical protein